MAGDGGRGIGFARAPQKGAAPFASPPSVLSLEVKAGATARRKGLAGA